MAERERADIAVIGAGPSGMAAAMRVAKAGVSVVLLDEFPEAGGAVWRGLANASGERKQRMIRDYSVGFEMLERFSGKALEHKRGAKVWEVSRDRVISYSQGEMAKQLTARRIILATGALERPMPFPGWTLPGVMTAGAAQIMLKTSRPVPAGQVVMAGSGPLLYLVATQLLEAGHPPEAIIDTTPRKNRHRALRHLPMRTSAWASIAKGLSWQRKLRRAGVNIHRDACKLKAHGEIEVREIRFQSRGQSFGLPCTTVLIHAGLVPNVQLSRAIGVEHVWAPRGLAFCPRTDDMGRTDIDGILIAGDGAGIAGAEAAVHSGVLAALAALEGLADVPKDEVAQETAALKHHLCLRPFLNTRFAPGPEFLCPEEDTIVCRCEGVTAGQVRRLVKRGSHDPNAVKSLSRAGMGPCQGRYCGLTVSQLMAEARGISPAEAGYFRLRSPIKPVTLAELAGLEEPEEGND